MVTIMLNEVPFDAAEVDELLGAWGKSKAGGSTVKASDFRAPNGAFLLATSGTRAMGCCGLRRLQGTVGEIKRLYVDQSARGIGLGPRLLKRIEEKARDLGFSELRLDTDGSNPNALTVFRELGFEPIEDYNGNEYARFWFAKVLTE